jgi:PTS system ascorbate-specific IIB component
MVRIMAVCGAGLGSSMACMMAIQSTMQSMGVDAKVGHTDTASISAVAGDVDIVVAGNNYHDLIEKKGLSIPVVYLDRLVDKKEIQEKLTPVLKDLGAL